MALNEFLNKTFYGNTIELWAIAIIIVIVSYILGKIAYWIFGNVFKKLTAKTETKLDDIIIDMIEEPIMMAIILYGINFAVNTLILPDSINSLFNKGLTFAIILNIGWLIARLFDAIFKEYIIPLTDKTETDFDDQIVPIIRKGVNFLIWTITIIVGLDNAGYNVGAIIAGLGIGGLALAMAAKDTISNIFGGVMIFLDKPFKIKDRIKISGFDGFVEEIGLRSTRLKTLAGTEVTIPNSTFTENPIENISREPSRKITLNLGLTYDTSDKDIKKAMDLLEKIAKKHSDRINSNYIIAFNSFGDYSLGILFIYYIKKSSNILETQTLINLDILKYFNQNKIKMAFPTYTVEITK